MTVTLASNKSEPIQGMKHHEKGDTIRPDMSIHDVDADDFDALVIPGGVANPDVLRTEAGCVEDRPRLLRSGEAGSGNLPRSLAAGRGGTWPRAAG